MPANNVNNKKSSNNSTSKNSSIVNKVVKNVKKMDITSILLIVVVLILLYLVFFDNHKKTKLQLYNHRHQRRNEGFDNNSLAKDDKCVLVLFHADWCGYCKKFMPTWNIAKSSLKSSDLEFKDFEADTDKEVMKENEVSSYPTLKLFTKGGDVVEYEGDRTLESLEKFIEDNKD